MRRLNLFTCVTVLRITRIMNDGWDSISEFIGRIGFGNFGDFQRKKKKDEKIRWWDVNMTKGREG